MCTKISIFHFYIVLFSHFVRFECFVTIPAISLLECLSRTVHLLIVCIGCEWVHQNRFNYLHNLYNSICVISKCWISMYLYYCYYHKMIHHFICIHFECFENNNNFQCNWRINYFQYSTCCNANGIDGSNTALINRYPHCNHAFITTTNSQTANIQKHTRNFNEHRVSNHWEFLVNDSRNHAHHFRWSKNVESNTVQWTSKTKKKINPTNNLNKSIINRVAKSNSIGSSKNKKRWKNYQLNVKWPVFFQLFHQ